MHTSTYITVLFLPIIIAAIIITNIEAAPSNSNYIAVYNNCPNVLTVGQSENGQLTGTSIAVEPQKTHTFTLSPHWQGRVWARTTCQGRKCNYAGLDAPASLAEFLFRDDHDNLDYYDISFVDGYNIPLAIEPINPFQQEEHHCTRPSCAVLPLCPRGFEIDDEHINGGSGEMGGKACKSACSAYNTDEYCCTGQFNSPEQCRSSTYSAAVKSACPDAYSYAYDDATSTFACRSDGYKVTFCPNGGL